MAKKNILKQARANGLTYKGHGHINGVPALSLTPEVTSALRDDQIEACLNTGLYEITVTDEPVNEEGEQ